jgi:hypothetical protein
MGISSMTRRIRNRLSQLLGELGVSGCGDDFPEKVSNPAVGTLRESPAGTLEAGPRRVFREHHRGAKLVERDGLAAQEDRKLVAAPARAAGRLPPSRSAGRWAEILQTAFGIVERRLVVSPNSCMRAPPRRFGWRRCESGVALSAARLGVDLHRTSIDPPFDRRVANPLRSAHATVLDDRRADLTGRLAVRRARPAPYAREPAGRGGEHHDAPRKPQRLVRAHACGSKSCFVRTRRLGRRVCGDSSGWKTSWLAKYRRR